jgi:DnaJ-class molecular chaperone
MIRVLFLLVLLSGAAIIIFQIVKRLVEPRDSMRCSRCDGKGFWLGARGREKCDWCNGTGRLPR